MITPSMIEKRLRILDQSPQVAYWQEISPVAALDSCLYGDDHEMPSTFVARHPAQDASAANVSLRLAMYYRTDNQVGFQCPMLNNSFDYICVAGFCKAHAAFVASMMVRQLQY